MKNQHNTLEDVVSDLLDTMSSESKETLKLTPKDDLISYLHTAGRMIRNQYNMWYNTELVKSCDSDHPDGASMIVIETLWERLNVN